jgi:hypothetical protein
MKTPIALLSALLLSFACLAQSPNVTPAHEFGKIDMADLQLKECEFEKDANAMVLFDMANIYFDQQFNVVMERHKRIKIFNDKGKDEANIRIPFYGASRAENITNIQVQTINENNGKPEITKIDRKLIYTQNIDKYRSVIIFSFPNVKAGSVIEFKYTFQNVANYHLPDWYFQGNIPVRYSEVITETPEELVYRPQLRIHQTYAKNSSASGSLNVGTGGSTVNTDIRTRALANIPSLHDEPFMSSRVDNLESAFFQLVSIRPIGGFVRDMDSWAKVGGIVADDDDFGGQLKRKLSGEEAIIAKAKAMKSTDEKIAFIFNEVKTRMKWNGDDQWYTYDGTPKAWEKQTGSSSEINIQLYHLLKQSGLAVYPMLVSTRDHGKVNTIYPFLYQFNRTVVYMPIDSAKHYILDATSKYNAYNITPSQLLNSTGLYINKEDKRFDLVFLKEDVPSRQSVFVTAEVLAEGKIAGSAEITATNQFKVKATEAYKTDGEEKYKKYLRHDDNNVNIEALKMENIDVDTLPLVQKVNFKIALNGADGTYIYVNPNLFPALQNNPFLAENRATDIDFGFQSSYTIAGTIKIPAGYKVDALPQNISMVMPDNSIIFKRLVADDAGLLQMNYRLVFKKSVYFKENYAELREFYKKLDEMMNEQVVLKKVQ